MNRSIRFEDFRALGSTTLPLSAPHHSSHKNSTLIAALHLTLLLARPVLGAEQVTADVVLEKYVKAIGGREAWNKVESCSIKAEFEGPFGATSGWSLQAKAPNKRLTRMDSSPWGVLLDGFDGTTAWSKNQNGVQTKTGEELSRAKKEADLRREVRLKELYPDLVFKERKRSTVKRFKSWKASPLRAAKSVTRLARKPDSWCVGSPISRMLRATTLTWRFVIRTIERLMEFYTPMSSDLNSLLPGRNLNS
jgi:hypothetical protein